MVSNMLITLPNNKHEPKFDILVIAHTRLVERFKPQVDTSQPLHIKTLNAFLGRIYHFDKQTTKTLVNDMAKKGLLEIKKGPGIANYFIILRRHETC